MTALQVAATQACSQMTLCVLCSAFCPVKSLFHFLKEISKQIHSINELHAPPVCLSVSKAMYSPVQMHHLDVSNETAAACSQLCQRKARAYWMAEEIISKPLPVASAFRKMASASPVTSTQNGHVVVQLFENSTVHTTKHTTSKVKHICDRVPPDYLHR